MRERVDSIFPTINPLQRPLPYPPTHQSQSRITDAHGMLAALVRHKDETLINLLDRLDTALDAALTHQIFTDEING